MQKEKPELPKTFEIVKPKDLQRIFGLSYRTACRRYTLYRDSLSKSPAQSLFLHEVMNFEGLQVS